MGSVTAAVHDSLGVLPEGRTTLPPEDSTFYTGTFDGSAHVDVYSATNGWVSLGDPRTVTFAVYCLQAALPHENAPVPPGTYSQARLTLDGFVASINAGAVIDAVVYDSAFTVALADGGSITIEKPVTSFEVTKGSSTKVLFDLNSEVWLDAGVVAAGTVPAAEVQGATIAYLEGEPGGAPAAVSPATGSGTATSCATGG